MLRIGFTNEYYTLWDCKTEVNYTNGGAPYNKHINNYIKNLSTNKEQAISKAKELGCTYTNVDYDLKGETFTVTEKPIYEDWQFKFGKYENKSIKECTDSDYLLWFYENTKNVYARDRFLELNKDHRLHENEIMSQTQYDELISHLRDLERFKSLCDGREVELEIYSNINSSYLVNTSEGWIPFVGEVSEMSYNGFVYYLPTHKGKGKRIKNKTHKCILSLNEGEPVIEQIIF